MIYVTEQQIVLTSGTVVIVGLVALFLGIWWGKRRGREEAEEEIRWAREQAKARRTHPVYRQPSERPTERTRIVLDYRPDPIPGLGTPIWNAPEPLRFGMADDWPGEPPYETAAITTGEIQAITDETDAMVARWKADNDLWMAEHGLSDS